MIVLVFRHRKDEDDKMSGGALCCLTLLVLIAQTFLHGVVGLVLYWVIRYGLYGFPVFNFFALWSILMLLIKEGARDGITDRGSNPTKKEKTVILFWGILMLFILIKEFFNSGNGIVDRGLNPNLFRGNTSKTRLAHRWCLVILILKKQT